MSHIELTAPVGQIVAEKPGRARVLEQYGIEYCCGGKKSLARACADQGVEVLSVVRALEISDDAAAGEEVDWTRASISKLVDHIIDTHHAYLKEELPRLSLLVNKVAHVHGESHPELNEVARTYAEFRTDMEMHMRKEEAVLFPMCKQLEATKTRPRFHCGSIANPIDVMEAEHEAAGQALLHMRLLTQGFTPPPDACNTYRVMLDGLAHLEADTHQHVHKENNILFPMAASLEGSLSA